jgi:hypothetical protein
MDDALREGDRYGAGGIAGAERVSSAWIWIVKTIDPS